ncbi:YdiU family protein [Clostridiales bacterium COT073_COT-073]|nr:YdiU family protein [Clostridiales bacterium COT073_COT-073]
MKVEKNHIWQLESTYQSLPERFYTKANPAIFPAPELVIFNEELAKELGLEKLMAELTPAEKAQLFSGMVFPEGSEPISQAYGGHQFGYFNILGDGRAILLGERLAANGQRYDIQLKGSGRTAYSRNGDGKAVIGPMLREYLISEAMYALKIPTSRSLAVSLTGEKIYRHDFLPGAVLTRVAASHLRVGTFQFAYMGGKEEIQALADYAIDRHYPQLNDFPISGIDNRYQKLLAAVIENQAELIAKWQLIGFVHGVMNTDNMTISGETIDYGPCAFLDEYNPAAVFSSIDSGGRYRYENQPPMGQWNLSRLADAMLPLIDGDEDTAVALATGELLNYAACFHDFWRNGMKEKLGISGENKADEAIIGDLLRFMEIHRADYTNTFVRLTLESGGHDGRYLQGTGELFADDKFIKWKELWKKRQQLSESRQDNIYQQMKAANPFVIPRNFRVEDALADFAKGNITTFLELLQALMHPYDYNSWHQKYQELSPKPMTGYRTFCGT